MPPVCSSPNLTTPLRQTDRPGEIRRRGSGIVLLSMHNRKRIRSAAASPHSRSTPAALPAATFIRLVWQCPSGSIYAGHGQQNLCSLKAAWTNSQRSCPERAMRPAQILTPDISRRRIMHANCQAILDRLVARNQYIGASGNIGHENGAKNLRRLATYLKISARTMQRGGETAQVGSVIPLISDRPHPEPNSERGGETRHGSHGDSQLAILIETSPHLLFQLTCDNTLRESFCGKIFWNAR